MHVIMISVSSIQTTTIRLEYRLDTSRLRIPLYLDSLRRWNVANWHLCSINIRGLLDFCTLRLKTTLLVNPNHRHNLQR